MEYSNIENEYVFLRDADIITDLPDIGQAGAVVLSNGVVASELFKAKYEELSAYDKGLSDYITDDVCVSANNLCMHLKKVEANLSDVSVDLYGLSGKTCQLCTDLSVQISSIWADIKGGVNYKGHVRVDNTIINSDPVYLSDIFVKYLNITPDQAPNKELNNGWLYNITLDSAATNVSSYTTKDNITLENNDYLIIHNHNLSCVKVNEISRQTIDIIESLQDDYVRLNQLESTANALNDKITKKIWIKNPSNAQLADGSYSDLSVIKLKKDEYIQNVVNDQISEKTIYIISSDYIDAYGASVKNIVMENQGLADASEAVNVKCLALSVNSISNIITEEYSAADSALNGKITQNFRTLSNVITGNYQTLSDEISANRENIEDLYLSAGVISSKLDAEINRNLDAVHYKGDLTANTARVISAFLHDNLGGSDGFEFKRGFMYRFADDMSLGSDIEESREFGENDYIIFVNDVALKNVRLSDIQVIKDYDSEISSRREIDDQLDERIDAVSNEVSTKIWIKDIDSPELSNGAYSDLSVIKISKPEYLSLLSSGGLNEKALYILSSNYIDAYNQVLSNLVMPGQTSADSSVAVNKKYADGQIQSVLNTLAVSAETLAGVDSTLGQNITENRGRIDSLASISAQMDGKLNAEISRNLDSMHFKGNLYKYAENENNHIMLNDVLAQTIAALNETELRRGYTFRVDQPYLLRDSANKSYYIEKNDCIVLMKTGTAADMRISDLYFIKDYDRELTATVNNVSSILSNRLSSLYNTDIPAVSNFLSGEIKTILTSDIPAVSNFLSGAISSILTADLPDACNSLSSAISSKIWIQSKNNPELSNGAYSDLSVVKLTRDEYTAKLRLGELSERCIYIISSDNINADGQPITNLRMQAQSSDDISEAVNVKFIAEISGNLTAYSDKLCSDLGEDIYDNVYKKTDIDSMKYLKTDDTSLSIVRNGNNTVLQLLSSGNMIAEVNANEFVIDGMLNQVSIITPANGDYVGQKVLQLIWNTDADNKEMMIPLTSLVDTYTAGTGITISENNEISIEFHYLTKINKIDSLETSCTEFKTTLADYGSTIQNVTELQSTVGGLNTAVTEVNTSLTEIVANSTATNTTVNDELKPVISEVSAITKSLSSYINTLSTDGNDLSLYSQNLSVSDMISTTNISAESLSSTVISAENIGIQNAVIDGYLLLNGNLSVKFDDEIYQISAVKIQTGDNPISVLALTSFTVTG